MIYHEFSYSNKGKWEVKKKLVDKFILKRISNLEPFQVVVSSIFNRPTPQQFDQLNEMCSNIAPLLQLQFKCSFDKEKTREFLKNKAKLFNECDGAQINKSLKELTERDVLNMINLGDNLLKNFF